MVGGFRRPSPFAVPNATTLRENHQLRGSNMLPIIVVDLPFLAREVNDAHAQTHHHAKGMLLEAKRTGDALLARIIHQRFGTAARRRVDGWRQRRDMTGLEGCGDRFVRGHVAPAVTAAA